MEFQTLSLAGPLLIHPRPHRDTRGVFMETFRQDALEAAIGKTVYFVQDNQSVSKLAGTLRGLHIQVSPAEQGKLVRCTGGKIRDVIVDVRKKSKTYGQYETLELSPEGAAQLWVPPGFLHGFVTLMENTEVQYKVTSYYSPEAERRVLWSDPDLNIDWGIHDPTVSSKDSNGLSFAEYDACVTQCNN